ncbi:hypothetical protein PUNSTDRAFT_49876 [Punctularia strigosozonata HHB-11173 SS5]|uniref:uncharacterized protein n=1 Tax=Punctularia strigosozonata (strain HHB-11173) TaxID=741275 RepID=UPI0004416522|nr:uncharacterized protein PUNSTDRAFT_49876 [Punctularia strigosozonata HHB-11173 SS5]EIN12568.1 hypothetical protein PUNSTDRAFT_49876 [Punctularia strigosozonata HHB-11173 SS5]
MTQTSSRESFTHVAPVEGRLLFTFGDITSTIEGYFILRYRAFNIHSNLPGEPVPIIAECYGQPFRVYSTKDFPGLAASTNLTKLVNKWGVKTNVREFGRSRGKKTTSTVTEGDAEASGSSSTGGTKRKADATEWSE